MNKNHIRSLQVEFIKLQDAEKQTTDALNTWTNTIAPGFEITEGANAAIMTKKTLTDIAVSLKPLEIYVQPEVIHHNQIFYDLQIIMTLKNLV
jgi:hypothetical protein